MMAAIVLGLAVFGSYSVQSSMGDVYVMAALGVMMYFLERFGFSAAPLVLGLILGPIAESNFIQGSMIATATDGLAPYFLTGPLNLFLIAVVILSIFYSAYMELRTRRYTSKEEIMA
jgi:putative tricarboxylic transport membrane protein